MAGLYEYPGQLRLIEQRLDAGMTGERGVRLEGPLHLGIDDLSGSAAALRAKKPGGNLGSRRAWVS